MRRAIMLAVALVVALHARRAHAWQEAHETGDDAHIVVDSNGVASVQHQLRWHVVRGPLKSIDLVNVDPMAVVAPTVSIAADDGRALGGRAVRRDERTVRITPDDPRALMRGDFTFDVRWQLDLVSSRAISREGGAWQLALSSPVAIDGFDVARTAIDLPAAPEGPRAIVAETGATDESAVATLQRFPERDVLELVRPHVARGASTTWTVRVDPRALPLVTDPRLRPPPEVDRGPEPDRIREAWLGAALAALAVGFGLLTAHKARRLAEVCAARAARVRALLPLPDGVRATLAGVALATAVGLEMAGERTAGAACVSLAMLAAAMRAPTAAPRIRGPGRWLTVCPEQAFAPIAGECHWLDIGSSEGRLTALLALALVGAAALVAKRFDVEGAWLVALDAAALVPLFVTGCASQLPPHGARSPAPWLARAFRLLHARASVKVTPWARVAPDGVTTDELRLLVMPRVAMPGVIGLEVGIAWSSTPVCWAAMPEVLARVLEGSAAAAKLAREVPRVRAMPGRRPDERVLRLLPHSPTRSSTVALVRGLADALTDRRIARPSEEWPAFERRSVEVGVPPLHVGA